MFRPILRRVVADAPRRLTSLALVLALSGGFASPAVSQTEPLPSIADKTAGTEAMEGFFDLYWDEATGTIYWEIAELDTELDRKSVV